MRTARPGARGAARPGTGVMALVLLAGLAARAGVRRLREWYHWSFPSACADGRAAEAYGCTYRSDWAVISGTRALLRTGDINARGTELPRTIEALAAQ